MTMKIKLIKPVVVSGCDGAKVGDILDVPAGLASYLVGDGNAEFPVEAIEPERIQVREPSVLTRDPIVETLPEKPSRRRAAK
jgi:hypothetical protein